VGSPRTNRVAIGCLTALLVSAGCAHRAVAPAFALSVHPGSTVLLLTPLVTVTWGKANEIDERASQAASENVGRALKWYLEQERGLKVVSPTSTPEQTARADELYARVAHVRRKLQRDFENHGRLAQRLPPGITIHSIEEDLSPASADALVVVQGSDHVSDLLELGEQIFAGKAAGVTYLDLIILAPSGDVIFYDELGEEGMCFLTNQADASRFVADLASYMPRAADR